MAGKAAKESDEDDDRVAQKDRVEGERHDREKKEGLALGTEGVKEGEDCHAGAMEDDGAE
jgi:hypothetical protein